MNQLVEDGHFQGRVRVLITGGILVADARLTTWTEGGEPRWGGSLLMGSRAMAIVTAADPAPSAEFGDEVFPFTVEQLLEERRLRVEGHGRIAFQVDEA